MNYLPWCCNRIDLFFRNLPIFVVPNCGKFFFFFFLATEISDALQGNIVPQPVSDNVAERSIDLPGDKVLQDLSGNHFFYLAPSFSSVLLHVPNSVYCVPRYFQCWELGTLCNWGCSILLHGEYLRLVYIMMFYLFTFVFYLV